MVPRPPRCTRTDTLFPYNDALPIARRGRRPLRHAEGEAQADHDHVGLIFRIDAGTGAGVDSEYQTHMVMRSEEHTSELQSLMRTSYAVFCLKKNISMK